MNTAWEALLGCLPAPPAYRYDWEGLSRTALNRFFIDMARTQQNPFWHGEGDVWTHTQMVCDALTEFPEFRTLSERRRQIAALAALLHDLGKIPTTRLEDGQWTSPNHGAVGAHMAREVLWKEFGLSGTKEAQTFREAVCLLIANHMKPDHILDDDKAELKMLRIAANSDLIPEFDWDMLCLIAQADVTGRIYEKTQEQVETVLLCRELAQELGCLYGAGEYASEYVKRAYLSGRNVWRGQELFEDCWGEVILMCALPGTGKDTWIAKHHSDLPMVSLDELRIKMGVSPTANQGTVVQAGMEAARVHLRAKQEFVFNATNMTSSTRGKLVQLFENYGARVRIVFLETAWDENMRRNDGRRAHVPQNVIERMLGSLEVPQRMEAQRVDWLCV